MLHFTMNMPFYLMALYGSVMIIAVMLLRGLLKDRLPKFVFPVLWGLVLIRLLVPFSLSSPLGMKVNLDFSSLDILHNEASAMEQIAISSDATTAAVSGIDTSVEPTEIAYAVSDRGTWDSYRIFYRIDRRWLLCTAYLLGLLATVGGLARQKYRYSKKLQGSFLIEHNETVNAILREMAMGDVLVFTNDEIASPLVCGLFAPRIFLPARMDFGNTQLLRHVLSHETMHIRRRDNWIKAAMLAALCLNWYNPLVWLMSKCLSSDLEKACDAAVLKGCGEEERKGYAMSLLAMAITGSRSTLLYSAFSKLEVEKRIRNVLHYKKASLLCLLFSIVFLSCSTVAFATAGVAPFSPYLSSFCASSNCRWGVKASLARDIAAGGEPQERADNVILDVLIEDQTGNREILEQRIKEALADEFGVEKDAFTLDFSLRMDDVEREKEYTDHLGLIRNKDGSMLYQGEKVRTFADRALGFYQSWEEGTVDIFVKRDVCGIIDSVDVYRQGDREYEAGRMIEF